jgi:hypothetical protein
MPLKLRWKNSEPMCQLINPYHEIIFKNGDGMNFVLYLIGMFRFETRFTDSSSDANF